MENFVKHQEEMQAEIQKNMNAAMDNFSNIPGMPDMKTMMPSSQNLEEISRQNMEMFQNAMRMMNPFMPEGSMGMPAQPTKKAQSKTDRAKDIKQAIQDLQAELKNLQG